MKTVKMKNYSFKNHFLHDLEEKQAVFFHIYVILSALDSKSNRILGSKKGGEYG